jgi:pyrimidine-specific ribonucleoside hydrolase
MYSQQHIETGHQHGGSVIFLDFPHHAEDYQDDVREIMDDCLSAYGEEEWKLIVLTGELHGHLGIYAIIGAKMGLFAREYLATGPDEVRIVSMAGSQPPLSCLNDGLQVSTGATMGHGLFSLDSESENGPSAIFMGSDKKIRVTLEPGIWKQVRDDIQGAIRNNNGLTEGYWQEVRVLGLRYWKEFNREEIFIVEEY